MKKGSFLRLRLLMPVLAAIASALVSCGKTDLSGTLDPTPNPGPGPGEQNETAFLAVRIGIGGVDTKALGEDQNGEDNERQVNSVYIVLYDADNNEVAYRFDLDANSTDDPSSKVTGTGILSAASRSSFTTKALGVAKKDYNMIVLVNPNSDILTQTAPGTGKTLADFESAVQTTTVTALTERNGTADNFFMTNANGPRLIVKEYLPLGITAAESSENTYSVTVERAVARIDVTKDAGFTLGSNIELIGDIKWTLDNTNKKTYWMRHAAATVDGSAEERNYITNNHFPILTPASEFYATDPNVTVADASLDNELNRLRPVLSNLPAFDRTLSTTTESVYLLENTLAAGEQAPDKVDDRATRILLRANIKYKDLMGVSWTEYLSYGDKVFPVIQACGWYQNNSYPAEMGAEFPALVASANAEGVFDFSEETSKSPDAYIDYHGIIFHKDGLNIFSVPIRHFDADQNSGITASDQGYYGVVRNNVYHINLKGIANKSKVDNKVFLSASINIGPFTSRVQDVEF